MSLAQVIRSHRIQPDAEVECASLVASGAIEGLSVTAASFHAPANVDFVAESGSAVRIWEGETHVLSVYDASGASVIDAPATSAGILMSAAANGQVLICRAYTGIYWDCTSRVHRDTGVAPVRTDVMQSAGACSETWVETVSSITSTQATRTTDAACTDRLVSTQLPFATATGDNRKPGNDTLDLGTPTNGGTARAWRELRWDGTKSRRQIHSGRVQTANATPATCLAIPFDDSVAAGTYHVEATVTANRASNDDAACYVIRASFKLENGGGSIVAVGAVTPISTHEDAGIAAASATIAVSGHGVAVNVTGIAATLQWGTVATVTLITT